MTANQIIRLAICGASGRMGQQLIEMSQQAAGVKLTVVLDRIDSSLIGVAISDLTHGGHSKINVSDRLEQHIDEFDILIDFTRPDATLNHLAICQRHHKAMVIGTTGFSAQDKETIIKASQHIPIVFSANFSVGVTLMLKLLQQATQVLGNECDIEIIEAHHRHKIDAPSGTALVMGEVIAATLGDDLAQRAVYCREGNTGERKAGTIGFATIRAGDIVGEHSVIFADTGERLEITHKATSRANFAKGALRAARWLSHQPVGLYTMQDVLALSS